MNKIEAQATGEGAYIFGYPMVLMDVTRQVMTAVPRPSSNKGPVNQFIHIREFPNPTLTDVVSPNADTLYSTAWLDVGNEPMVLTVPDMRERYYLMQMMDAWTNVIASPGTRTTGNGKGDFAISGPDWKGKLPVGMQEIKSPTDMVWVVGRTQTNGKDDYAAVRAIQDQYKLTPLSAWGRPYAAPDDVPVAGGVDTKTPPVEQVGRMNAAMFFALLTALLKENPPAAADDAFLKRLAAVGIAPGSSFNLTTLEPEVAGGLEAAVSAAQAKIIAEAKKSHGKVINGWQFMSDVGRYGTNYLWRAVVALIGLGANQAEDAVYPRAIADADGQPLVGANQYVVRFPKGQLPPVNAFWSITLYNNRQFFVQNPIDRYAIGDRDKLKFDDDGGLTIYVQNESPGKDLESNWLPAPKENFSLFMRLYWPKPEILSGSWKAPTIQRAVAAMHKVA